MAKLKPIELERFRRRQLNVRRLSLAAQQAQLDLDAYKLELEVKYGLVGQKATLYQDTGEIEVTD